MSGEGTDSARGEVDVIILNNQGEDPLDLEVFREAARRKVLEAVRTPHLAPDDTQ